MEGIKVDRYQGYTGTSGITPYTTVIQFPDGVRFYISYNTGKSELIINKNNQEDIFCQHENLKCITIK